jgi:hypothetical protein
MMADMSLDGVNGELGAFFRPHPLGIISDDFARSYNALVG